MEICTQQSFQFVQDLFIYGKTIQLRERCRDDIAARQHGARLQRPWVFDGPSAFRTVDGAVAQGENGQVFFRAALHAGEHLRRFSIDCDRAQLKNAPDQAEILPAPAYGVHGHVQKIQHLGFIVSFLAEIFCQLKEIETVVDTGLHLGEGTGAVAAFPVLEMANAVYTQMSTFSEIEIEDYQPLS